VIVVMLVGTITDLDNNLDIGNGRFSQIERFLEDHEVRLGLVEVSNDQRLLDLDPASLQHWHEHALQPANNRQVSGCPAAKPRARRSAMLGDVLELFGE
jgi:hypothetical protein